jgi:hypothetical protein
LASVAVADFVFGGRMRIACSVFISLSLLPAIIGETSSPFTGSYVSLECPDGDIELVVRGNRSCTIEKKWWDPTEERHMRTLKQEGTWRAEGDFLTLRFSGAQMRYRRKKDNKLSSGTVSAVIPGLEFVDSTGDHAFDHVALLDKPQVDAFLLSIIPGAKKP